MRIEGPLSKWNDDRGFGFITPAQGGSEIFAHISAFPRNTARPQVGEWLSFEVETDGEGKKRAKQVQYPRRPAAVKPSSHTSSDTSFRPRSRRSESHGKGRWLLIVLLGGLAVAGYQKYLAPDAAYSAPSHVFSSHFKTESPASVTRFQCDGRTQCSQMNSCEEAKYFLKHCPGTQMDGDGDGIPCEQQWCH